MLSIQTSINNFIDCSVEQKAKGFLYKIKNEKNQTISYLFGTIHNIPPATLFDDKVIKKLSKCQTLYLERNIFDKNEYLEEGKKKFTPFLGFISFNEQEYLEKCDDEIAKLRENPSSAEALLALKAESLGIPIKGLETFSSRSTAIESCQSEINYLKTKSLYLGYYALLKATHVLKGGNKLIDLENPNNPDNFFAYLFLRGGCKLIKKAKNYFCLSNFSYNDSFHADNKEENRINHIFNKYKEVFISLGKKNEFKKIFHSKEESKNMMESLQHYWIMGDKKLLEELTTKREILAQFQLNKVSQKIAHHRDVFMGNQIDDQLSKCSKKERSFYAIGTLHVKKYKKEKEYNNVKEILENKGWQIINAYEEKNESVKDESFVNQSVNYIESPERNLFNSIPEPESLDDQLEELNNDLQHFNIHEKDVLNFSLIYALTKDSKPEIGQFLHLPQLDPLVRKMDEETLKNHIQKLKSFLEGVS